MLPSRRLISMSVWVKDASVCRAWQVLQESPRPVSDLRCPYLDSVCQRRAHPGPGGRRIAARRDISPPACIICCAVFPSNCNVSRLPPRAPMIMAAIPGAAMAASTPAPISGSVSGFCRPSGQHSEQYPRGRKVCAFLISYTWVPWRLCDGAFAAHMQRPLSRNNSLIDGDYTAWPSGW